MVHKIIVPHDGTNMSDKALEEATRFAEAFGGEIVLVHVVEEILIPATLTLAGDDFLNKAKRSITAELVKWWEELAKVKKREIEKKNVRVTSKCLIGKAAECITKFAKENQIEIIIMGSRRFRGVSKIMALGSVARKVSENAECNVLIVH
ncbi:MAG TPA: universal stress protein [Nitrososphaeraceae archaeon]